MKKKIVNIAGVILILGFSVWLWAHEPASQPGNLSSAHDHISDCNTCHIPWQGVTDQKCRQCHYFRNVDMLKPQIRFHEAQKHCIACHSEHKGYGADISGVDHQLFNEDLSCTECHFDPHEGKFGEDCRACHSIHSWNIQGFRHPPGEDRECFRCHSVPNSHQDPSFWDEILERHQTEMSRKERPPVKECWRCHITHKWGHLVMGNDS